MVRKKVWWEAAVRFAWGREMLRDAVAHGRSVPCAPFGCLKEKNLHTAVAALVMLALLVG